MTIPNEMKAINDEIARELAALDPTPPKGFGAMNKIVDFASRIVESTGCQYAVFYHSQRLTDAISRADAKSIAAELNKEWSDTGYQARRVPTDSKLD